MEVAARWVDLREPPGDTWPEAAQLEDAVEGRAARDLPGGLDPVPAARGVDREAHVDALVADERHVHEQDGPGAATPARRHRHVPGGQGIREHVGLGRQGQAPAHDGLPALGLVDRQVDALRQELAKGALEAVAADEPRQVAELAARVLEKAPVDAGRVPVDRVAGEREEVLLTPREPALQLLARFAETQRAAQEPCDGAGEPRGDTEVSLDSVATGRSVRHPGEGSMAARPPSRFCVSAPGPRGAT